MYTYLLMKINQLHRIEQQKPASIETLHEFAEDSDVNEIVAAGQ